VNNLGLYYLTYKAVFLNLAEQQIGFLKILLFQAQETESISPTTFPGCPDSRLCLRPRPPPPPGVLSNRTSYRKKSPPSLCPPGDGDVGVGRELQFQKPREILQSGSMGRGSPTGSNRQPLGM